MNKDTIITGAAGEVGILASEIAIPHETIQIVLQIVIGIVTLVKLLKKEKK